MLIDIGAARLVVVVVIVELEPYVVRAGEAVVATGHATVVAGEHVL